MAGLLTEAPPQMHDDERPGPWATPPGLAGLGRPDVRVPAPLMHDSGPINGSSYGDWTRPSRSNGLDEGRAAADLDAARGALLLRPAPGTTMIPEREIHRGHAYDEYDDGYADDEYADDDYVEGDLDEDVDDLEDDFDAPHSGGQRFHDDYVDEHFDSEQMHAAMQPVGGPGTGPVGGRAAKRAEREAADVARRKAAKGRREAAMQEEGAPRRPRRVAISLLAMALVALGVLGVYSFATPDTQVTGAQSATTPSAPAAPSTGSGASAVAPQPTKVQPIQPAPVTPVRLPVTVLNATQTDGLAAKVSAQIVAGGWQSPGVGAYSGDPVAVTTVFFTEGDEQQRQAAVQLVDQFQGKINGPAPRFFDVPDVASPGLVVVAAGDWQP